MDTAERQRRKQLLERRQRGYAIRRHVDGRRNGKRRADLRPGDRIGFDGKATSWLVRAEARHGRYHIATCVMFGIVHYTIIDHAEGIRGALNVIGGGAGIMTKAGPDDGVDDVVEMLETIEIVGNADEYPHLDPRCWPWEVSHRNQVPLRITKFAGGPR